MNLTLQDSAKLMKEKYPKETLWSIEKIGGQDSLANYPVGYWVIGFFNPDILKAGDPIRVGRLSNANDPMGKKNGLFVSSAVESFKVLPEGGGWEVVTKNSVYEIKRLTSIFDSLYDEAQQIGFDIFGDSDKKKMNDSP
jgi:hypothetical protein